MSDVQEQSEIIQDESGTTQQIIIDITDSNVSYTSQMSVVEVVFWLDVVQAMLMNKITSQEGI